MKIPQPFGSRVSRYVCKILVIKIAQIHKFGLVARLWNLRGSRQITTVFISIGLNSENTHSSLRRSRNLDPSKVSNVRASRQLQLRQENLRWCHRARLSAIKVTQSPPVGANLEFRPIVMKTAVKAIGDREFAAIDFAAICDQNKHGWSGPRALCPQSSFTQQGFHYLKGI
jgi:hypothetical protein